MMSTRKRSSNSDDSGQQPAASTTNTVMIRPRNLPADLKALPHWLVWRYERNDRKPDGKPLKVPYWTNGRKRFGKLGSAADVAKLDDFDSALAYAREHGYNGVGLAILAEQDITVLDVDDCISPEGEYSEFAQQVLSSGSYVERSPSGRGLRAVYRGALVPGEKRNFHIENGERVEVYCGGAYTTFTGRIEHDIPRDTILALPKRLRGVLTRGMQASGQSLESRTATDGDSDDSGALASMNAAALPNMTTAQALRVLNGLPERWGTSGEGTWYQVAAALHMQFDGSEDAYEVLDEWSSHREGYDPDSNRARWDAGFAHAHGKQNVTSMRNLVFEARDAGVRFKQATLETWGLRKAAEHKAAEDEIELPEDELAAEVAAAWHPVDITGWATEARPEGSPPLVKNWLYESTVALFSSHGGGGKSYIMLTFAALAATGGRWFGEAMMQGGVLVVNGEDPLIELRHRLWGICRAYDIDITGLAGVLDIVDVTGVLHKALYTAGTDYGRTEFTKQFEKLRELVTSGRYKYIVLDNLSKFYMANENARPMVDEFISALAALATEYGCGVVLVGHDSKLGGQGYSGSTAWHNSARARWGLTFKDGRRELIVEKNNYGRTGHGGVWAWDDERGVIAMGEPITEAGGAGEFSDAAELEPDFDPELDAAVLAALVGLVEAGVHTGTGTRGRLGAIAQNPGVLDAGGTAPQSIRNALARLEAAGRVGRREYRDKQREKREEFYPLSTGDDGDDFDPING